MRCTIFGEGVSGLRNLEKFDPQKHICKFGFELHDYATQNPNKYNIICNLYQRELSFEFINKRKDEVIDAIGFKLNDSEMNSLLPIVRWEEFEKYRDLPTEWEWDFDNGHKGYRDGWGYKFWCLSESGYPLLQIYMSCIFGEDSLPPYERLLDWVRSRYKDNEQLKEKDMLW